MSDTLDLKDDLIRGAAEIGQFLFGDDPGARRRVYHLVEAAKDGDRLPIFKLGATLCARRSSLVRWISERENA
jgi:hypothetical protein